MNPRFLFSVSMLCCLLLTGCVDHTSDQFDSRLIGTWQRENGLQQLTFYDYGTYGVEEGESGLWSTDGHGHLTLFGNTYTYEFRDDNTMLVLRLNATMINYSKV